MTDKTLPTTDEKQLPSVPRSLETAVRNAKSRLADYDDVSGQSRHMELLRLQLLAEELHPMIQEIDENDRRFDFGITHGDKPRLWVDMTSFVSIGLDNTTYRFLKDTRMGRVVLAETKDELRVADIISDYVAERIVERERFMEGEWETLKASGNADKMKLDQAHQKAPSTKTSPPKITAKKRGFWANFGWFFFGIVCTLLAVAAAYWGLSLPTF